jgi:hypothetical protein
MFSYLIRFIIQIFLTAFRSFLLLFFVVHAIQAGSVVHPVRTTLLTAADWLGIVGEGTERTIRDSFDSAKKKLKYEK